MIHSKQHEVNVKETVPILQNDAGAASDMGCGSTRQSHTA